MTRATPVPALAADLHAAFSAAAEALWVELHEQLPGLNVEVAATAESTNTRLLERARAGDGAPGLLVAVEQTAGRGRQGRQWHARPGDALTFSLSLPYTPGLDDEGAGLAGLSLAVGVVLAEALDEALQHVLDEAPGPRVGIKWPNDLWLLPPGGTAARGRKLGGVLIEVAPVAGAGRRRLVVIGVGINVRGAPPSPGLQAPAAGTAGSGELAARPAASGYAALDEFWPDATPAAVWRRLVPALARMWQQFQARGLAPFLAGHALRDVLAGQAVVLWPAGGAPVEGVAQGVDGQGRLLVHTAAGPCTWASGEVSVRLAVS